MSKHTRWSFIVTLTLCLTLVISLSAQEKRPMTFVDTINTKRVSGPRLSPDGNQILFTITEASWEKKVGSGEAWSLSISRAT